MEVLDKLDHVWSNLRLWVRRVFAAVVSPATPAKQASLSKGAKGSKDDPAVWAALATAHAALDTSCPLPAADAVLLSDHLVGASGCVMALADRAYTNQGALAGDGLDSLVKGHAVGAAGVPAGPLRRFLAATDMGKAMEGKEVKDAFADAVDKKGCPWADVLEVFRRARDPGVQFREGVERGRRNRAAARARAAKPSGGSVGPKRVITCSVCKQPGHNKRSPRCRGAPQAGGDDGAAPQAGAQGAKATATAAQKSAEEGRRLGACLALRWHILGSGSKLKGGDDCATVPLPKTRPCEVYLEGGCVHGVLKRALLHARRAAALEQEGKDHAAKLLREMEDICAAVASVGHDSESEDGSEDEVSDCDAGTDCDSDAGTDCDTDCDSDCDSDSDCDGHAGTDSDSSSSGSGSGSAGGDAPAAPTDPPAAAPDPGPTAPSAPRRRVGLEPLFNLAHRPLAAFLRKDPMPAQVTLSGTRGVVHFTVYRVRLTRRMEGTEYKPARWVNFSPRSNAWARPAGKAGHNGAGVRTLSTDWYSWLTWRPGAYSEHGIPEGWTLEQEGPGGGTYICIDPGIRLPLACHNGLALPSDLWYAHRAVGWDFKRKPEAVRELERSLGGVGRSSRAWGLVSFSKYLTAFYAAWPRLRAYYGSSAALGAKAWKGDKLRSALDQLLHQVAPHEQVPRCFEPRRPPGCAGCGVVGAVAIVLLTWYSRVPAYATPWLGHGALGCWRPLCARADNHCRRQELPWAAGEERVDILARSAGEGLEVCV